jgi:hypothetical protein
MEAKKKAPLPSPAVALLKLLNSRLLRSPFQIKAM